LEDGDEVRVAEHLGDEWELPLEMRLFGGISVQFNTTLTLFTLHEKELGIARGDAARPVKLLTKNLPS